MRKEIKPSFEFQNHISPRYIEPLFLHLQYDRWYTTHQLIDLLHLSGLDVEGTKIVSGNIRAWHLAGLGQIKKHHLGRNTTNMFTLTELGKNLIDTYSTNPELFYDLIHFFFYSAYHRSGDVRRGPFWLYSRVCDTLWKDAPGPTDNLSLTNRLQVESREKFTSYDPSFSEQSVRGVFPWLQTLVPPFLTKQGTKSLLYSTRRSYCTPQLFHLATDMVYTAVEGVPYETALAIDDQQIEAICKVCLLDLEHFWEMADLTQMTINGYDIQRGQWGTSFTLAGPPSWIALPDFSHENEKDQADTDVFADTDGGEE